MDRYGFDKHLAELGIKPGNRILVAVSGGMDSMSLLDALFHSSMSLKCSAAHVNFHLRGNESDSDELLVREWCAERGVELFVKHVDTLAYAKTHAVSIEMAARELRYAWFHEQMVQGAFDFLAIAHNADDNAETLLLNLVRGTGMKGLCGIAEKRGYIVRPLLGTARGEIEKYVFKFKVPYRTDHTNLESDFARNRIRNEIFPRLKRINPSLIKTLNRNIRYFSLAGGILDGKISAWKERLLKREGEYRGDRIVIEDLYGIENWPYVLYEILREYGFNPAQAEDISAGLADKEVKRFFSPGSVLVKERGMLKIYPVSMAEAVPPVEIPSAGGYDFAGLSLTFELQPNSPELVRSAANRDGRELRVSADALVFPLLCRPMSPGDRFFPFGMKGMKKISDFLTDIKTDHILRHRTPVLLNGVSGATKDGGNEVICLPGLRIDSRFQITRETKNVLIIKIAAGQEA